MELTKSSVVKSKLAKSWSRQFISVIPLIGVLIHEKRYCVGGVCVMQYN